MSYTNGSVALAQRVRRQQGGARQPDGCAPGGATGNMSAHQRGAVRRRSPELESRTPRGVLPATEIRRRMERRAVMVQHTVQIQSNYDGLRGCYGTVLRGDVGDGTVLVAVSAPCSPRREICYATREVRHVAMDDAIMHDADEECRLIRRYVQLGSFEDYLPYCQAVNPGLAEAVKVRLARLLVQIRAIQRVKSTRPGSRYCTALVLGKGVAA